MRYYLHSLNGSTLRTDDFPNDAEAERHATAYARHYGMAVDLRALLTCEATGYGTATRRVCGIEATGARIGGDR